MKDYYNKKLNDALKRYQDYINIIHWGPSSKVADAKLNLPKVEAQVQKWTKLFQLS